MTETRKPGRAFWTAEAMLFVVFVMYPLSVWPVTRLHIRYNSFFGLPHWSIPSFYMPLQWLADHCKPFANALEWYTDLWWP